MPNLKGNSWCYENSADSCAKYGRLYTWTAAMNIDSSYQWASATAVIFTPQQGACPAGWHIPKNAEWTTLENAVGGSIVAGTELKSVSGWYLSGNGTDAYGFSALPAGYTATATATSTALAATRTSGVLRRTVRTSLTTGTCATTTSTWARTATTRVSRFLSVASRTDNRGGLPRRVPCLAMTEDLVTTGERQPCKDKARGVVRVHQLIVSSLFRI